MSKEPTPYEEQNRKIGKGAMIAASLGAMLWVGALIIYGNTYYPYARHAAGAIDAGGGGMFALIEFPVLATTSFLLFVMVPALLVGLIVYLRDWSRIK